MKKSIAFRLMFMILAISLNACAGLSITKDKEYFGNYIGTINTQWLPDGRRMRILELFTYIDPNGVEWPAPAGSIVDGASIPQWAWSIMGGPFEGKYRDASVIHDVACDQKKHSWEATHMAFYTAMRASGVDSLKARIMYGAVYHCGPRWPMKCEFKAVDLSSLEGIKSEMVLASAPGTDVTIESKIILSDQPNKANVIFRIGPHPTVLTEADFAKLKAVIEEREKSSQGPMSLKEIQNYNNDDSGDIIHSPVIK